MPASISAGRSGVVLGVALTGRAYLGLVRETTEQIRELDDRVCGDPGVAPTRRVAVLHLLGELNARPRELSHGSVLGTGERIFDKALEALLGLVDWWLVLTWPEVG